jgi:C4-dicarboxylate transporter, DctM subunit
MAAYLPILILVLALLAGIPIAVALAVSGMIGIYAVTGDLNRLMGIVSMAPYSSVADHALTTIPMFVLMAYLSASAGLAKDLYTAASSWLSQIRGGLAIGTVAACGIFGAMSGASVAGASVMSKIAIPEMRRHGYSDELAAGAVGIGATLNILIPPSVAMVIYGIATQTSIGKLLIAGVIPGLLLAVLLSAVIYFWVLLRPSHAPQTVRSSSSERWGSLKRIGPSLMLIIVVLALLYSGVATPTEVGAVGAAMAALIGWAHGRLSWADSVEAVKLTIRTSAMIFLILIGATIFGYYMALSRIPHELVTVVTDMEINRWVVMLGIIVAYFVISMFMDEIPLLLLTLQVTFPLIVSLGFDPVWFGVMSMMMMAMGLVFPPVGIVAFVVSATGNVRLEKVFTGTGVLITAIFATTALLMVFPQIALWLPATMR